MESQWDRHERWGCQTETGDETEIDGKGRRERTVGQEGDGTGEINGVTQEGK